MAYIDTTKVTIPKGFFEDLNVPKLLDWLNSQPTADVVPKSEVERLKAEIRGYDVAKKYDAEHFMADIKKLKAENDTLIKQRDKLLQSYAKEIFDGIEKCHFHIANDFDTIRYAELKKKYTEVNDG